MNKRDEYKVLGRTIGTATGWDGEETVFVLYEFEPANGVILPACDLTVDYEHGMFQTHTDDGKKECEWDMIEKVKHMERES